MATVGELLVRIGLNTAPLTAGMAKARGELATLEGTTRATSAGISRSVGIAGAAVAGGVAVIGIEAIRSAEQFQASMTTVQNNLNLSGSAAKAMGDAVTQASLGTDTSANTMATALGPVAGELARVQGGALSAAAATQVLTAAQNLHEGANIGVDASLKDIADTLLVYHRTAADAASVSDVFFEAQAQLGLGTDQVAGALQKLEPRLAGTGIGFEDTMALVREMTPIVGTGARALTQVGTVLQSLTAPTSTAQKALAGLGVTLVDAQGKFIGVGPALDRIHAAMDRLPPIAARGSKALSQQTLLYDLFGKQSQIGAALVRGGTNALNANAAALGATGTASQAAERNSKTLADQEETLKATISTTATILGTALIPAINAAMQAVLPIVTAIAGWMSQHRQLSAVILIAVGVVGALGAALVVLGPIFGAIGAAIAAVGVVLGSPILLPLAAVGVALALLVTHWQQVQAGVQMVVGAVVGFIRGLLGTIQGVFGQIGSTIMGIVTAGQRMVAGVIGAIAGLPAAFGRVAQQAVSSFLGFLGQIPGKAAQIAGDAAKSIVGSIPGVGAVVGGAGDLLSHLPHLQSGAANIPQDMVAVLHAGEMVIPPDVAAAMRRASPGPAVRATSAPALGAGASDNSAFDRLATAILAAIAQQRPLIGELTVNNPKAEPAGTSIVRELQKQAAFGYVEPAMAGATS